MASAVSRNSFSPNLLLHSKPAQLLKPIGGVSASPLYDCAGDATAREAVAAAVPVTMVNAASRTAVRSIIRFGRMGRLASVVIKPTLSRATVAHNSAKPLRSIRFVQSRCSIETRTAALRPALLSSLDQRRVAG